MKHRNRRKCSEVAYLSGVFIELYVLHAAVKEPVAAGQLVEVLTSRGYDINNRSMSALLRKFRAGCVLTELGVEQCIISERQLTAERL